ncbi:hypothetical protein ACJMK2_021676, partial [Sinanodonta woodiana]
MASNFSFEEDDTCIANLFSETTFSWEITETNHLTKASLNSTNTSNTIKKQTKGKTSNDDSEKKGPLKNHATWIRSKIKMRTCIHFVSRAKNSTICHCGHEKNDHPTPKQNESNLDQKSKAQSKYVFLRDTCSVKTNAFGEIEFVGRGGDVKPKFVRVDNNIDMSVIMNLIKRWGLEYPNLLISVAGDTDELEKSKLRDGIMKAARDTGAWLITDGTDSSGMNQDKTEPANILKEHVVIGIAPWGVICNRQKLVKKKGSWPAKYDTEETCKDNERFLDPNHSHYILVDDGTQHKLDIEIPFRLKLEHEMAKIKTKTGNDVLSVTLFMGGGEGTLRKVNGTLQKDRPVVVVKGSGGAADILAFAFQNASTCDEHANSYHGQDSNRNETFMPPGLKKKLKLTMKQKDVSCNLTVIQRCLSKSELIHIADLDSDNCDIKAVLLKALMKAYGHKMNISIAMLIFSEDVDESIIHILQYGGADIVKQLINQNRCAFTKFSTSPKKIELYKNVFFKRIFNDIRSQKKKKKEISLNDVRYLVQDLVDSDLLQHYNEVTNGKEDQNRPDNTSQGTTLFYNNEGNEEQDNQESNSMDPCMDLLIWSVLNNRQDIAKEFWRHGKVKMVTALVAHALLSAMSREIDDRDLREAIDNSSSEFMTLAIKTAKACSKANEEDTYKLLKAKSQRWGNTTCIEIALNSRNKEFLSLKVCRDLIHKIWMGGLKPQNSIMTLLLCIAFPPFIIWLARFEIKDDIQ